MVDHEANMAELRRRHEAGDRRAVADALFLCLCSHPPKDVPAWVCRAYREAYGAVFGASVGSWDDVLGEPAGHAAQRRKRKLLETAVWKWCRDQHARGMAIDNEMFAVAGKEFGCGARQAKDMYYECERAFGHRSNLWSLSPAKEPWPIPDKGHAARCGTSVYMHQCDFENLREALRDDLVEDEVRNGIVKLRIVPQP